MTHGLNLHVYPSPITHESRMLKLTKCIGELGLFDRGVLVGMWREGLEEHEEIDENRVIWRVKTSTDGVRLFSRLDRIINVWEWKWRIARRFGDEKVGMINCHNLATLPLGLNFKHRQGSKLVYDTHELETERGWPWLVAQYAKRVERKIISHADLTVVVSASIGQWYHEKYKIANPLVIRNVPPKYALDARKAVDLKAYFDVSEEQLLFIFQGSLGAGRCVELVLEVFQRCKLDRHIVFMGFGPLQGKVEEAARKYANIHFHLGVKPDVVLDHTRSADVGFHLLSPDNLNHQLTLGNKPFEYLLAGIPFIESDYTEGARFVRKTGCGWTVETSVETILAKVNELDRAAVLEKKGVVLKVRNEYSWENESRQLAGCVSAMFNPKSGS